jgi:hypothetical protein
MHQPTGTPDEFEALLEKFEDHEIDEEQRQRQEKYRRKLSGDLTLGDGR